MCRLFTAINTIPAIAIVLVCFSHSQLKSQDCNIVSKANDMLPDKLCAPVTVIWEVTYRGVNDNGTPVEIQFNWDDGNPVQIVAAINTNPDPLVREWKATVTHVYPQNGPQCNYLPEATLMVNGVLCTSSVQQQNVTVWDTDDYNGGELEITPQIFPICVGNDGLVSFTDISIWNCVPPVENDNPNNATRWTQWVYGTNYTINNVLVNGVAETYPYYGAVVPAPGAVYGPVPPNNVSLPCYSPNSALTGQFFELTLRNWNYCNPYDDPNIPGPPADPVNGDNPPLETTAIILIVPFPDATIQPAGPFCSNASSVTLNAATPGGTWSGNGITNPVTGQFSPSSAGPGTHTITYSVTDANGCTGVDTVDITIFARPTINILPGNNLQACPGDTIFIDGNPTPGSAPIVAHLWTGNTTYLSQTNIQNPYFTTTQTGTYNLSYRVTDANGCYRVQNITISIAQVWANIIPYPAEACAGIDFQLDGNPAGGSGIYVFHNWTGDTQAINMPDIQNPVFNTNVPGIYNLIYNVTDENGCSGSDSITVTVFDTPLANAGVDDTICGLNYQLNAIPSLGTGTWQFFNGPDTVNFSNSNSPNSNVTVSFYGTYTLIWYEDYGPSCTDYDTLLVTFVQLPVADAGTDTELCGLTTQIQSFPSCGTGVWQQVSGPSQAVISNPENPVTQISAPAYGTYSFIWEEDNGFGCVDSDTVDIVLNIVPVADFSPADTSGCTPFPVTFVNNTTGGSLFGWYFSDGTQSTAQNPSVTFYNQGSSDVVYTVLLTASNAFGCIDSVEHSLTVHPLPYAGFFHDAVPSCSPLTVNFTNTSSGSLSFVWDFGDGSPVSNDTNPAHTFINTTNLIQYYEVLLVSINEYGCRDSSTQYITVYPTPGYSITAAPNPVCHPAVIQFVTQPGASGYLWNFGDGSSQSGGDQISHPYSNTGTSELDYTVELIVLTYFGCTDTSWLNVTIFPKPAAGMAVDINNGCTPAQFQFTNTSSNADSFTWKWGDGNSEINNSSSLSHSYTNQTSLPVSYTVTLIATNSSGCTDSASAPVTVYPPVFPMFTCDTAGCSPFTPQIFNYSQGAVTYYWDFGNGNTSTAVQPVYEYSNTTGADVQYTLTLYATSVFGCSATFQSEIYVWANPAASFTATPQAQAYPSSTVTIDNTSSSGLWNYYWDFGDSAVSGLEEPGLHTYQSWGSFDINLIVSSQHCSDTAWSTIQITAPSPVAEFSVLGQGCAPLEVIFTNQSLYSDSYLWDFGDGFYSTGTNPAHIYYNSGDFPVTLTATGPGGQSFKAGGTVHVFKKPVASFYAAPSVVFIPSQPVKCYNTSSDAVTYLWDFGDGSASTEKNPQHYYSSEGEYTITLIASTEYQCTDTFSVFRAVVAKSEGQIIFPSAFSPNAGGSNGGYYNPGDINNDVFHPVFTGVDIYEMNIFNRWGELIFESKDINTGWDGYYRNELCKQDVYVWKAKGKFINGQSFSLAGDVTLIR